MLSLKFVMITKCTFSEDSRKVPLVYTGTFFDTVIVSMCDGLIVPDEFIALGKALSEESPRHLDENEIRTPKFEQFETIAFNCEHKNIKGKVGNSILVSST